MLADSRMERAGRTSKQSKELSVSHSFTRTAAIVVVGDEILAAKVQDVNTHFLCSELRAIGWRVCKVSMLANLVGQTVPCLPCNCCLPKMTHKQLRMVVIKVFTVDTVCQLTGSAKAMEFL